VDLSALSSKILKRPQREQIFLTPAPLPTPEEIVEEVEEVKKPTSKPTATAVVEVEEWRPTTELSVEYSSGIRFNVEWPRSLRAFAKNPLLGTGYSSVTLATDNDYLRLLAETGLMGFVAFFLIFLEIGRRVLVFLKKAKPNLEKALVVGLAGGALGLLTNAFFIDVFESSKVAFIFWILMGSLVGMIKLNEKNV
ncbi:O-antigen ligase family protein, partial [Patescibacteria group bacterium]|nr:O-antigen ligase family protein [Patescibacteria group bacterium]